MIFDNRPRSKSPKRPHRVTSEKDYRSRSVDCVPVLSADLELQTSSLKSLTIELSARSGKWSPGHALADPLAPLAKPWQRNTFKPSNHGSDRNLPADFDDCIHRQP